jgi:branched-chain amino acid transport system permease protein
LTVFIDAIVGGIATAAIYGLIAVGYVVSYNATRVFNLAQGDLVMIGVMLSYWCLEVERLPQVVAFLVCLVGVTGIAMIEELVAVRPFLRGRAHGLGWLVATLGFGLILETTATWLYGEQPPLPVRSPLPIGDVSFGPIHIAPQELLAFLALCAIVVALEVFYRRTWTGMSMRAMAEDRELSGLRGSRAGALSGGAFAIAGAISGMAGYVIAPIVLANTTVGTEYSLKGFVALAVGGFGSIRGALVGALALGIGEQLFDAYVGPVYEISVALMLLLAILVIRPVGLFGQATARAV